MLRNPILRLARTALLTAACGYLGLAGLLYLRQGDLIFPGARTQDTPDAQFAVPERAELLRLSTSKGDEVAVLWSPGNSPHPSERPRSERRTVVLFYGNGMCLADAQAVIGRFRGLGADVLTVEYPGYGQSTGQASEAALYACADAVYDYAVGQRKVAPRDLYAVGISLGGAVALDLAARRELGGVVTMSTFTSIADVAAPQFPLFPVRALLRHRFETRQKIQRVHCPVLLIHGTADEMVPFRMRDALAEAAAGPVTRYDVDGGGHNNLFRQDELGMLRAISAFIGGKP